MQHGLHACQAQIMFVSAVWPEQLQHAVCATLSPEAEGLQHQWGKNELEEKTKPKWLVFLELLYAPMPIMIWVAFVIEMALQNWIDAGILFAIQMINAVLGW